MPKRSNSGILGTIGKTPLVKLERMFPEGQSEVFAKIERFNPGGSIKDRSGLNMIAEALRSGELTPGRSVVVESSSGNLAVGLAQICRYYGLRFICVVDAKTTEQNLAILKAYRAEVEVVDERDAATGEFLPVRLRRVRELLDTVPHAYSPNQYANLFNPKAHQSTMHEIVEALDGRLDYLFCSVSTFGTLRGCADYIHRAGLPTTVVAVDADGSAIFGRTPTRRLIPGHGASVRPALMDPGAADEVVHVSDLDCVVHCRRLVAREAILAGGSSGAVLAAMDRMLPRIPPGSVSALIFPDGGDRYLKTIYSDDWVRENFGEVSHLWKG
ncbi:MULTISPECIES: 2,3-diaminopropionate biosynthesis protein SbnA [unclassified Streptomyces]|uniref:2,3-diaminopropionate biosynthesis protein SbnA n=1 Tax=unclassified Streptomyces TaxID=2593676 RepID=UPI002254EDEB|nr:MULTISPECIES: 2,3-diaminopropionate biosynthesis protein SbnA [unclassified Streptomyces]MCX4963855.1 2,3-diaminopropionate biosynthesis protein SbnA [Streptomyces sp. NBC_00654]MEE1738093.1 2,3-diaminopropionate biosynthesis protein SbnA [Streptomyces sp. BE147]